jgi:hypothetical protein
MSQENPLTENTKSGFYCEKCDYTTCNKKDYTKHENTKKHQRSVTFVTSEKSPYQEIKIYSCKKCSLPFKNRMALCRHNKVCEASNTCIIANTEIDIKDMDNKDVIFELIKQNKELQNVLIEQNNTILEQHSKLIEMTKNNGCTLIQNNTTNNTTNNSFNLNFFLNEQCKDAIDINDFINSLELNVNDLKETGKLGYVLGISRIFINRLKELDVYARPLHCTDVKRETVYIKDQNAWEKENSDKSKLKKIVNQIAKKNLQQLPMWQAENPEYTKLDTPENQEYMKISLNSLGSYTPEQENKDIDKIVKNVLKEVAIDKN